MKKIYLCRCCQSEIEYTETDIKHERYFFMDYFYVECPECSQLTYCNYGEIPSIRIPNITKTRVKNRLLPEESTMKVVKKGPYDRWKMRIRCPDCNANVLMTLGNTQLSYLSMDYAVVRTECPTVMCNGYVEKCKRIEYKSFSHPEKIQFACNSLDSSNNPGFVYRNAIKKVSFKNRCCF